MTMNYQIDIESNSGSQRIPPVTALEGWITTALQSQNLEEAEVSLYIVDEKESQELNAQYRGKDKPTNVLSFPADIPEEVAEVMESLETKIVTGLGFPAPYQESLTAEE